MLNNVLPADAHKAQGYYAYLTTCKCGTWEICHANAPSSCSGYRFDRKAIVWVDGLDGRSPADAYVGGQFGGRNNGD